MKEEPSTSSGIKRSIPQELQDEIDEIVSKRPRTTAKPADLDENQKTWLVVGICLHSVISPALRSYVVPILTKLCYKLSVNHRLETQTFPTHLQKHPITNKASLNYEGVNNNKVKHGNNKQRYDYTIKSVVDLSKLFLQTHMVHYTGFDDTCDSSALLGLIINIDQFDSLVKSVAEDVRRDIRNDWAHCDFSEWDAVKYLHSFQLMKKLIKDLKLSLNEETQIIGEIEKWEMNVSYHPSVNQPCQNHSRLSSGTMNSFQNVQTDATCIFRSNNVRRDIRNDWAHCDFSEWDAVKYLHSFQLMKKLIKDLKLSLNEETQIIGEIEKWEMNGPRFLSGTTYGLELVNEFRQQTRALAEYLQLVTTETDNFHFVEMEHWKKQEEMFVETPAVIKILQCLESEHTVLIVGEPGIGKSMLMHHVALKIHSTTSYCIVPCSGIQDIFSHYNMDKRQMFVIDDICGRFTSSLLDIECLIKNEDKLKRMLIKGKTKIAATCRLDIYFEETFVNHVLFSKQISSTYLMNIQKGTN
ncbi:unnamed protein product [Mytilus edulis]|uniref:Novel STAND NTPase 3 domain-containing protein n=1 Tax=Mytilus edulis TaxID=6550 RepID=A0A8S3SAK3_MYTED|nr:unnamed protein product [Mytilus edulis]